MTVIDVLRVLDKGGTEYVKTVAVILRDARKSDISNLMVLEFARWVRDNINLKDPRQLYFLWKRWKVLRRKGYGKY